MRYEADAAAQRVYPAGAFPDPLFRMELQNITNAGSDASPSLLPSKVGSTKYTLVQPIPFWGKRDLKREVAEADAEQAQGRVATDLVRARGERQDQPTRAITWSSTTSSSPARSWTCSPGSSESRWCATKAGWRRSRT